MHVAMHSPPFVGKQQILIWLVPIGLDLEIGPVKCTAVRALSGSMPKRALAESSHDPQIIDFRPGRPVPPRPLGQQDGSAARTGPFSDASG
eukprot:6503725-Pyramimonas_sp.AAC.2